MSVVSVRARSFILALFIRDDGERFLLGDNGFDFKDSQLHFSANTIENDEVAKQGVDGVMLAGQVRRASVQSFDGYVGDATTLKEEVEQMRRDFIAFFAKGHHFRVIYIDCNKNAWQRKGGYLVDAPEVKELWQIHPEYHVGLNFEDVNYYEYDENAEGEEILSNIISVPISSDVEGGLVWDENGAVSEPAVIEYDTETASASGTNISIPDAVEAPLSDFKLKGETSQNGTPTPSAPIPVQTVTGENVVKISDGQGNEQSYEVNLGKNLLDKDNANIFNGYLGSSGIVEAANARAVYIPVVAGQTYTFSRANSTSQVNDPYYAFIANEPVGGGQYLGGRHAVGRDDLTFTATAPTGSKYLIFYFAWNPSAETLATILSTYQLEKGLTATSYAAYFEPIELCKIGDYQDSIYKSGGKWYVRKEIGISVGSELGWRKGGGQAFADTTIFYDLTKKVIYRGSIVSNCLRFTEDNYGYDVPDSISTTTGGEISIRMSNSIATDITAFTDWFDTNGVIIYYPLATPTDTEITNEALVAQLEAILSQGQTYDGTNNITTVITAGNEQGELEITYYTKYDAKVVSGGYVWEAGGSGGPTIVTNDSISAVSPVWTVFGPALNPMLENTTTGEQIQYVGMIGEGQTLVVDMGEQTARLDGLNVISNIVGEYLTLAPGSNTLLFSAEGDAPASEIGWSEIVG